MTMKLYLQAKYKKIRISSITLNILLGSCEKFLKYLTGIKIIEEIRFKRYDQNIIFFS